MKSGQIGRLHAASDCQPEYRAGPRGAVPAHARSGRRSGVPSTHPDIGRQARNHRVRDSRPEHLRHLAHRHVGFKRERGCRVARGLWNFIGYNPARRRLSHSKADTTKVYVRGVPSGARRGSPLWTMWPTRTSPSAWWQALANGHRPPQRGMDGSHTRARSVSKRNAFDLHQDLRPRQASLHR
jgi:hypothetical protein